MVREINETDKEFTMKLNLLLEKAGSIKTIRENKNALIRILIFKENYVPFFNDNS